MSARAGTAALLALGLALVAAVSPAAAAPGRVGALFRYWSFSNHNDLRDPIVYWAPGPFHVQLEYWDFEDPDTKDHFRPEVGIHLRDRRRSVYTFQWRHERDQERAWFMTDQVLGGPWVARAEVSPIFRERRSTQWAYAAGADYYWKSWNFVTATVIRDPRGGGLWAFPVRVRLATERNDWVQVTVAPASERTIGWALDGKWHWARAGIERNNRYDFTDLDNIVFTAGVELPLGGTAE